MNMMLDIFSFKEGHTYSNSDQSQSFLDCKIQQDLRSREHDYQVTPSIYS